jgi:hypothetical protein
MRYALIAGAVFLSLLVFCGVTPTDSNRQNASRNPFLGAWILTRMERTSGIGSVTNTTAYNFTTSTSTTIMVITADSAVTYENDQSYTFRLASAYTLAGSSMYYYAGDTMMASIAGSQLTAESPGLMLGDSSLVYRYIFARYSGPVPPATWPAVYAEPVNPYAVDAYEPDESYSSATPIDTNGIAQNHTLYPGGELDWLKFSAVAGTVYIIETIGATDTRLTLYGVDGSTMLVRDDDGGANLNARIQWTCAASGTYYVMVDGYDPAETGAYGVSVKAITPSSSSAVQGDWFLSHLTITMDTGTGPITTDSTYTAQSTSMIWHATVDSIYMYSRDSIETAIGGYAYYISGNQISIGSDPGTYSIQNGQLTIMMNSGLGYSVTFVMSPYSGSLPPSSWPPLGAGNIPDSYEPDNTYAQATPITVNGASQPHTFSSSTDIDWFSFSAAAGTYYTLATTGSSDTYIELYDTNGMTFIMGNDDGGTSFNASLKWYCSTSGTYYFVVYEYSNSTGTYSVSMTSSLTKRLSGAAAHAAKKARPGGALTRTPGWLLK